MDGLSADIGEGARWGFEGVCTRVITSALRQKVSFRALLVLVVKGNCAIRAVSDTKWYRYGKETPAQSELASDLMQIFNQAS